MTDREKIISRLQIIRTWASVGPSIEGRCLEDIVRWLDDALSLLKAQEPVALEPKEVIYNDEHYSVYCPSCNNRLAGLTYSGAVALETEETPNYCWMCGQAVKW